MKMLLSLPRLSVLLAFVGALIAGPAQAQVTQAWDARHAGNTPYANYASDSVLDAAGDLYLVGLSPRWGPNDYSDDIKVVKYSGSTGAVLWEVYYDGPDHMQDFPWAIDLDGSGGVYVVGKSWSTANKTDVLTLKYDAATGAQLWARRWARPEHDEGKALKVQGSAVYVVGVTQSGTTGKDILTLKYSTSGFLLWSSTRTSSGSQPDEGTHVTVGPDGDPIVVGTIGFSPAGRRVSASRLNASNGATLWTRTVGVSGGISSDSPGGVVVHSSGDVILGVNRDALDTAALYRFRATDGVSLWLTTWAADTSEIRGLTLDPSGNAVVVGRTRVSGTSALSVAKFRSSTGTQFWSLQIPGTDFGHMPPRALVTDAAGSIYTVGHTSTQLRTVKLLGSSGAVLWQVDYDFPPYNTAEPRTVTLDSSGGVIVAGVFSHLSTLEMEWAVVKYSPP